MMKRMLALALAVVMLLAVVLTVSAEEKEEIFDEVDARNLYDDQAIVIPEEAKNAPVVDGEISGGEYTVHTDIVNYLDASMTARLSLAYKDGFLYVAVKRKADSLYKIQIDT